MEIRNKKEDKKKHEGERTSTERAGTERDGTERVGTERVGTERTGFERAEAKSAGTESAETDGTGTESPAEKATGRFRELADAVKGEAFENRGLFAGVGAALAAETLAALILPQILSRILDQLTRQTGVWLYGVTAAYCGTVLLKGAVSILNTYLSETLGWRLCDCLRVDLFRTVYSFRVEQHKKVRAGEFLERLEGDVNILAGFFSGMLIDILGSLLLVGGILLVFWYKSAALGAIFTVLAFGILLLFAATQKGISRLWEAARAGETQALGEFSQAVEAKADLNGLQKEAYARRRFDAVYARYGKRQVRASFLGNIPATVFFSLLNLGEGIVLAVGLFLMDRGRFTLGELYLILSYAGILNFPFYRLKNEFTQLPLVLAAAERIRAVYRMKEPERREGTKEEPLDGSVAFAGVSFGYGPDQAVLQNVSFSVRSGEKILLEGRTGSGKSTILQLIAGLYTADAGTVLADGYPVGAYAAEARGRIVYYIFQSNPVIRDTLRNHLTRYSGRHDDAAILEAAKAAGLGDWMQKDSIDLDSVISAGDVTRDEAQLIAWAGALLERPRILLADEFDASIGSETVARIDGLIDRYLQDTTILFVSHRGRSGVKVSRRFLVEAGTVTAKREVCEA